MSKLLLMHKNTGNRAIKISISTSFFNFWGFHMSNNIGYAIHKVLFCILVYFGHIWKRFQPWDFADNQVSQTKKYLINSALMVLNMMVKNNNKFEWNQGFLLLIQTGNENNHCNCLERYDFEETFLRHRFSLYKYLLWHFLDALDESVIRWTKFPGSVELISSTRRGEDSK